MIKHNILSRRAVRFRRGFTLLELLLGLAIFAIIAASLYGTFFSAWQMQKRAQTLNRTHREANWALGRIAQDLENMLPYDFTGSYPKQSAFSGDADKITFLIGTDKGLKFVSYHLESEQTTKIHTVVLAAKTRKNTSVTVGEQGAGVRTSFLVREEIDFARYLQNENKQEDTDIEILSTRILSDGLKFQYAFEEGEKDSGQREWRAQWDKAYLPAGVRVVLTFILPDKDQTPLEFKRDMYVPTGSWGTDDVK